MSILFSKSCEYGIQSALFLARNNGRGPIHLRDLSVGLNIPHHFLSKILQTLGRDGIVRSQKGLNGGYELGRPASRIYLGDIVRSIDGEKLLNQCVVGFPTCGEGYPCAVHSLWMEAKDVILNILQKKTVEDLAKEMDMKWSLVKELSKEGTNRGALELKTPTDILKDEHRAIERMLRQLELAVQRAKQGERVLPRIFRDILYFLQQFADKHHHGKEEDLLFAAMEEKGFRRDVGPLAVMFHEHEQGRSNVRGMLQAVDRYEANDPEGLRLLASNAQAFIDLLRDHIMKEDSVLFFMADRNLSSIEQEKLLNDFSAFELSNKLHSSKSNLLQLLENVEQELGSQ